MADTATFDEFVTVRSRHLLRIAYLLSGDHILAEDLLQTALAKSWTAWRRIQGDPEPYVRRVLVNTYNSWWRRRWHGERPTETLPEHAGPSPHSAVDERDQLWRALDRLPRQQRVVLVLRYFEDLTEAEIARTMDISPGAVKAYASRGLATLRLDPTLRALPQADEDAPAGNERLVAVHRRITQRRRGRLSAAAAACLIVIAAISGYALAPGLDRGDVADLPELYRGHRIVARMQASFAQRSAQLMWTPGTTDLTLFADCATGTRPAEVELSVNDAYVTTIACGTRLEFAVARAMTARTAAAWNVRVGQPARITLTVVGAATPSDQRAPDDGVMAVAVAEHVPFEQYPLPPRPARLDPLEGPDTAPGRVRLDGPEAQVISGVWRGSLTFRARAQTPGSLLVSVNGIPVENFMWWDYEQGYQAGLLDVDSADARRLGLVTGQTVVITVEPEHMTGDWWLTVAPPGT
ncbi:SigE family RNA polymerase sigma factor [Catellatospora aurea]|uniref:SigE family RNA polymerase sigma factor n=1 Tax=Catellatospora aurea TaxID=1337874 RepID=A0ABW2H5M2_9ACTN